jgi:hypothetical protein
MATSAGHAARAHGRTARTARLGLIGTVLAVLAAEGAKLAASDGTTSTIAVFLLVVGSLWFAGTSRTPLALALLMLYLGLLDGYLKLSSGSTFVTLLRDALLYAIVIGILVRSQVQGRRLSLPPLSGWILAYVAFVVVQIPNPDGGTLVHSLAGVRQHLEFVPLFFLGYAFVRDVSSLRRFVLLLLVIGAANGVVGYIQFNLSPQQLAAWGPGYAQRVNGVGAFTGSGRVFADAAGNERVRPFGLGSEAGDGGLFGVLALGGAFALASLLARMRYRIVAATCGVGIVAAIVTSEGRGVVVAAAATILAYGLMTATSRRRLSSFVGLAVVGLLAYFVVAALTSNAAGGAFRYQGLTASKILTTTAQGRQGQLDVIANTIAKYPLGAGLATAGPAAGTSGASALAGTVNAESEFSFLVLEAGIPGLVVVVGFTAFLLGLGMVRSRREPDPQARILLAAIISPIAGLLVDFYAGPDTVSVPGGPFLWFVGGVTAYWLVTLPRNRRRAEVVPS